MKVEALTCNNCGAPIDVPETAKFATCAHCGSRLAIRRTDSANYTEVLDRIDERTGQMSEDLAALRDESELERLDREWALQREQYVGRDQDGSTSLPSTGRSVAMVIGAIAVVIFAIFWIVMASQVTSSFSGGAGPLSSSPYSPAAPSLGFASCFPLFGVLIIVLVVVGVVMSLTRASRYSEAEQRYRNRRQEILRRMKRPR